MSGYLERISPAFSQKNDQMRNATKILTEQLQIRGDAEELAAVINNDPRYVVSVYDRGSETTYAVRESFGHKMDRTIKAAGDAIGDSHRSPVFEMLDRAL